MGGHARRLRLPSAGVVQYKFTVDDFTAFTEP